MNTELTTSFHYCFYYLLHYFGVSATRRHKINKLCKCNYGLNFNNKSSPAGVNRGHGRSGQVWMGFHRYRLFCVILTHIFIHFLDSQWLLILKNDNFFFSSILRLLFFRNSSTETFKERRNTSNAGTRLKTFVTFQIDKAHTFFDSLKYL